MWWSWAQVLHLAPSAKGHCGLDYISHSPEGVEKRAWSLLNNSKEPPVSINIILPSSDRPRTLDAQSDFPSLPDVAEAPMGRDGGEVQGFLVHQNVGEKPKPSVEWCCDGCLGEKENTCHLEPQRGHQAANASSFDNVSRVPVVEKSWEHMDSLLLQYKDAVGNECNWKSLFKSELASRGAQGGKNRLSEDPLLSALVHRFVEIETELMRRRSLQL